MNVSSAKDISQAIRDRCHRTYILAELEMTGKTKTQADVVVRVNDITDQYATESKGLMERTKSTSIY